MYDPVYEKEEVASPMTGFKKFPVKRKDGTVELIEIESIFYLEAAAGDTLIRTSRKKLYRSVRQLDELEKLLPTPPFIRCHRSFIVNADRVRAILPRGAVDHDFKMDPPVNRRLPISRLRIRKIRELLGV